MKMIISLIRMESVLFRKFLACGILICLVLTSGEIITVNANISVLQSAKISADTLISQFFYISTFPLDVITKLFTDISKDNSGNNELTASKKHDKDNRNTADGNAAKASLGYSIFPNVSNVLNFNKIKTVKTTLYVAPAKSFVPVNYVNFPSCCVSYLDNFVVLNIIIMLLLAILLTRKNIGEDNIVTKINNKKMIAQLL